MRWKNLSSLENSWELLSTLQQQFLDLHLGDKLFETMGSSVRHLGLMYSCKRKRAKQQGVVISWPS